MQSIMNRREMSDQVLLGIAQRRRGVELFYRSWKQTFDKRKLRSRKSAHALIELDWSLIALWGLCLLTQLHQRESRPGKSSVAKALRVSRGTSFAFVLRTATRFYNIAQGRPRSGAPWVFRPPTQTPTGYAVKHFFPDLCGILVPSPCVGEG